MNAKIEGESPIATPPSVVRIRSPLAEVVARPAEAGDEEFQMRNYRDKEVEQIVGKQAGAPVRSGRDVLRNVARMSIRCLTSLRHWHGDNR
ncbi:hypothetical protein SAMN05216573_12130 [Bradyrhizobium sp. Rc3b]|uniref:hypothetical protein n=1 Tax=Bradyrhizobium sp. Rc3b TaxID=1855322 RepID=UPI0008EC7310|nr:hypothetical protein [Bradyrhizobium sp. Rc3b]SFN77344.1 hypothetical protein SAMN05216573_12130 [Bradyrhizobium sp. Rc3b]